MTVEPDAETAAPRTPRPSIAERAQRRTELDQSERDRYDSLLRHLRAGQEIAVEPRTGWRNRFGVRDWHPIAGRLLIATAVVVVLYLAATAFVGWWRENRIDTWTGGDGTVQSGQVLASCPELLRVDDAVLPNWLRYEGAVFQLTDVGLPIGTTNIGTSYVDTGVTLDDLRLFEVRVAGLGPAGSRLLVRNGDAPAGQLYRRIDGCS